MEIVEKTKAFCKKHKKGVRMAIAGVSGAAIGAIIGKSIINYRNQAITAGFRICALSFMKSCADAVGVEKSTEIAKKSSEHAVKLIDTINESKISLRQFNNIYDNELLKAERLNNTH